MNILNSLEKFLYSIRRYRSMFSSMFSMFRTSRATHSLGQAAPRLGGVPHYRTLAPRGDWLGTSPNDNGHDDKDHEEQDRLLEP